MIRLTCPFCGGDVKTKITNGVTLFECSNDKCGAVISFSGKKLVAPEVCQAETPIENFIRRDNTNYK
jgi:hypothetical protein